MGYWKVKQKKNVLTFFERLAISKQRDPRIADSWYDISVKEIKNLKVLDISREIAIGNRI